MYAFVLLAFLGAEYWFINKLMDSLILRLDLRPQATTQQGFQRVINPSTGQFDNKVYTIPPVYTQPPMPPDYEAEVNKVLDLIDQGKY